MSVPDQDRIQEALHRFAELRQRPAVLLATHAINTSTVNQFASLDIQPHLAVDLILISLGGCPCCAYSIVRDLKRQFTHLHVFIPWLAKSAATLIALGADDLVLSDQAQLGPLDPQYQQRQPQDVPAERSCLETSALLKQIQRQSLATFNGVFDSLYDEKKLRVKDAASIAVELAGKLWSPLIQQLDHATLATDSRGLEVARSYAERILRRYQPQLYADRGHQILDQLITGYPTHSHIIDREELEEIGIPFRVPHHCEQFFLNRIAADLGDLSPENNRIEVANLGDPRFQISVTNGDDSDCQRDDKTNSQLELADGEGADARKVSH